MASKGEYQVFQGTPAAIQAELNKLNCGCSLEANPHDLDTCGRHDASVRHSGARHGTRHRRLVRTAYGGELTKEVHVKLNQILTGLKAERDRIDRAIAAREGINSTGRKRGRPPSGMAFVVCWHLIGFEKERSVSRAVCVRGIRPDTTPP